MKCDHCKHWFTKRDVMLAEHGICLKANAVISPRDEDRVTMAEEGSEATAMATTVGAFGVDMIICQLETTARFGCNQFESGPADG